MTTLYHGAHTAYSPHVGQCYTDDVDAARDYCQGESGTLATIEIELSGLVVVEVAGYDHDTDEAPADRDAEALAAELGADVIVYADETERARQHRTWRLLTQRAVDAVSIKASIKTIHLNASTFGSGEPEYAALEQVLRELGDWIAVEFDGATYDAVIHGIGDCGGAAELTIWYPGSSDGKLESAAAARIFAKLAELEQAAGLRDVVCAPDLAPLPWKAVRPGQFQRPAHPDGIRYRGVWVPVV